MFVFSLPERRGHPAFKLPARNSASLLKFTLSGLTVTLKTDPGAFPFTGANPHAVTFKHALGELTAHPVGILGLNPGQHPFHLVNFALVLSSSPLCAVCLLKTNRLAVPSSVAERVIIDISVINGLLVKRTQLLENVIEGTTNGEAVDANLFLIHLRPNLQRHPAHFSTVA